MKATVRFRIRQHANKGRPGRVWLVDFEDIAGKRHQEVVRDAKGSSSRELAEQRLEQILGEKHEGLVSARQRRPFQQLRKQYLTDITPNISAHTHGEYKGIIERRLAPTLDHFRVDQIGVPAVRALKVALIAKGFAASTINKTLVVLGMILSTAVADRELSFNPCDHVRKMPYRPSSVDAESGEVTERHALTRDQVTALISASAELAEIAAKRASTLDRGRACPLIPFTKLLSRSNRHRCAHRFAGIGVAGSSVGGYGYGMRRTIGAAALSK
jgi:hypothetical protein